MGITEGTEAESPEVEPRAAKEGAPDPAPGAGGDVDLESKPRVKTGFTGTGAMASPTPPPVTPGLGPSGLHAKVLTPGPVVQRFVSLGRYQLLSRLAVGGMAEVYLARQGELSGFKTLVVVKKVLPHLALKPDFIAMFLDEARIASMLDHPNVVRITEVGRTESEYFLAMELVQGKALASILQQSERAKTPLPHGLGALIVANAAAGLHHAHLLTDASGHPLGLVHRDISPQNIMVSFEGSVKVIDFGIARALGRLGDTSSGSLKGKLGYMAPEQARGETIDARADIFTLGVVLWECIAGRRLFLRENELATLRAVVYEPIPKPSKYCKVDPVLEVIIEHALARDLDERFQTAEEMRIALERWIFAAGGTSTHDLSTLMKSWFPSDHVQWQRAARLALDMQESDPPIEMAFPALAGSKSGGSKTGTSRPGSSGSGNRNRLDPARVTSGVIPLPGLAAPDVRPSPWRSVVVAMLLVLVVAVGVAAFLLYNKRPMPLPVPETSGTQSVRPTVQSLPTAPGTRQENTAASPSGQPAPASQAGPTSAPQKPEASAAREESTTSKRRKRAIIRRESGKRPNPFDKQRKQGLRPNPF
ncbi:MAG: protein kinase [Deltaproteobacteria bacterium]|nr:protein kinase [Deltaproteobacteria bacterium]